MTDTTTIVPCHLRTIRGQKDPVVFRSGSQVMANSLDVAAFFGKQHSVVMRSIRTLIDNDKSCACNFALTSNGSEMPNGGTRKTPCYNMTRDGFSLLVMGFTGKRAQLWKTKYIEAFNKMEREIEFAEHLKAHDVSNRDTGVKRTDVGVDDMDAGLDLLRTAETALFAESYLDRETLIAIRGTIGQAIKKMAPVREHLDA
jgi:Rha family phage regulatory protein